VHYVDSLSLRARLAIPYLLQYSDQKYKCSGTLNFRTGKTLTFRMAMSQYAERYPVGQRQIKMLDETLENTNAGLSHPDMFK
jgi:hypothetical protein